MTAAPQSLHNDTPSESIDIGLEAGSQPALMVFASDDTTFNVLADFCRARRIAARVANGGITGAVRHMTNNPISTLLMVDLDGVADPVAEVDALADVCNPGTMVIAIGSTNDVTFYRQLMDAGMSDYLVKPLKPGLLLQAIEKATRPTDAWIESDAQGTLCIFIGSRGGVGGSTVAVNTAWQIAEKSQKRVMLVDLDMHFGTSALALDLEPGRGLREMLENPDRIDGMFISSAAAGAGSYLHVLSAEEPLDTNVDYTESALRQLLDEIRKGYEFVFVEIPRSQAVRVHGVLNAADKVILVSDLSLGGMRDTMRILDLLRQDAPKTQRMVIASRVGADKKHELPKSEFERGIEEKIAFMIPEDVKSVRESLVAGKAVQSNAKNSKVVAGIDKICDRIIEQAGGDEPSPADAKDGKSWQFWGKG